jgi:hypothetical protein
VKRDTSAVPFRAKDIRRINGREFDAVTIGDDALCNFQHGISRSDPAVIESDRRAAPLTGCEYHSTP